MDGRSQVRHAAALAVRTTTWLRDEEALTATVTATRQPLRDADPPGENLGRRRGGQDQERPGPDGPHRRCVGSIRAQASSLMLRSGSAAVTQAIS
jgi:hypothetical protein